MSTKVIEVLKILPNPTVYTLGAFKEIAPIRNKQDAGLLLKALNLQILHEE